MYEDVNGVRTWFEVRGEGEPLVLLHGGFGDSRDFEPNLARLADRFRVFLVDRRGHGRTPDVPGDVDADLLAGDLAGFLERVVGGPAHLVGYSGRGGGAGRGGAATGPGAPAGGAELRLLRRRVAVPAGAGRAVPAGGRRPVRRGVAGRPGPLPGGGGQVRPRRACAGGGGPGGDHLPHPGAGQRRRHRAPGAHRRAVPGDRRRAVGDRAGQLAPDAVRAARPVRGAGGRVPHLHADAADAGAPGLTASAP
ncbi:alpha/beta fold hydrolase [Saccharothrix sp. MB29]|nr:alpha/beta fold hydrolase [Saccharothrix sp. MB29]